MNGNERREDRRIMHICEVEFEGAGVRNFTTRINDISARGVFVDCIHPFQVGTTLRVKFKLLDRPIEADAEVRYCMPQVGMGLRFLNLTPRDETLLRCFIDGKELPADFDAPPAAEPEPEPASEAPEAPVEIANEPLVEAVEEPQAEPLINVAEVLLEAVDEDEEEPQRNILIGNFAIVSLFDVIQMIENGRITGTLHLTLPDRLGEIHFNEGQIIGARSGEETGASALNRFLGATDGSFEFRKTPSPAPQTIRASSNAALILDLLHARDEEEAPL